jgi:carbon monoxide dehydrogenase subunit G
MELVNDFTVDVPVDEAWKTLTDVERIAPCLPGAQLQEIEGDVYRGVVKVKVGPILAQFKGQATFIERDETNHRAVLKAEGRDTGGKGNASALITAQLDSVDADSTKVTVTTDLTITGKVAQFGRGALADVSTKLLNQFVDQLETTVLHPHTSEPAAPAAEAATAPPTKEAATASHNGDPAVRKVEHVSADPVDLVDVAGGAVLKRLAPLAVIGLIVVLILLARRRRGS